MSSDGNIRNEDHDSEIFIEGEPKGKAGRKPIPIVYREVDDYIEGTITSKGVPLIFKIDKDDLEKVQSRHWYAVTRGKYAGCHITVRGSFKILYLHNFIMNRLTFDGKGQKESVDHINRDGLDNRKANLRIISQSMQNVNKVAKPRTAVLPEGCPELPRHVWYIKSDGKHGDRFGIDLKTEGIKWKSTSSKTISWETKLEQAKNRIEELYTEYPYLKTT
jgi:hypothetical protein